MTDQEQQLTTENPVEISNDDKKQSTSRTTMSQDIRYSTEPNDREKLIEKYNKYQVSDTNACNIRFLTDKRQKKLLFSRNEGKIISEINIYDLFFFLRRKIIC